MQKCGKRKHVKQESPVPAINEHHRKHVYSITCLFIHFTPCRIMKGLIVKHCKRNTGQMNFYSTSHTFEVSAVEELLATHKTFMFLSTAVHTLNMTTQLAACGESLLTFCALVRSFT